MALQEDKDSSAFGGAEDETDYIDYDLVEFHDDEFEDIAAILKLHDTVKDKITFTIYAMNTFVTSFIIGYLPQFFYIWHTAKAITLISYRWYSYKKQNFHYFLFDFCYFTNLLLLMYIWVPSWLIGSTVRGMLFSTVFTFSYGPLMSAIILWRNSLVLHSGDKMTSLFIHVSPPLAVWGIRWHATLEQDFPLCSSPTEPGPQGCNHVGWNEIVFYPMMLYIVWQVLYIAVVEVWRKKRVEERKYATGYKWIVERAQKGYLYSVCSVFGAKYRKAMFIMWQSLYTIVAIVPAYFCYHYHYVGVGWVNVTMAVACYNGASFYIDVFSQRYYNEKVVKPKSRSSLSAAAKTE